MERHKIAFTVLTSVSRDYLYFMVNLLRVLVAPNHCEYVPLGHHLIPKCQYYTHPYCINFV